MKLKSVWTGHFFQDAMDNLIAKIDEGRRSWDDDATYLLAKNKQTLLELGLHPLEL